ncbi:hypothetical protein JOB18_043360 [Solea senegalensis]|uniref:Uncharacterized protein n=2 Tax=Solea senegalensis TaxID=28829 RepID=A0AAV6QI47_SOLSE|nr:hypothetical protein JOB18_043360 [Solea senegalensis]
MPREKPKGERNEEPKTSMDNDYVSMCTLRELLDQQKLFYKDMLDLQEKNFKTFLTVVMDSTNKRIDDLVKDVLEYKHSMEYSQSEVEDLKSAHTANLSASKSINLNFDEFQKSLEALTSKMDYIENQTRRNNILIDGIKDEKSETWHDTEVKAKKFLADHFKMDPKLIEVERAHRNGTFQLDGRPRTMTVKLLRFKDKEEIIKGAKCLKGTKFFINEDFSERVRSKRKELMPRLKEERMKGNIAYLKYDQLIVHAPSSKPTTSKSTSR